MTSLLTILSTLILFQLALMALFLFTTKKGKTISNRLLGCFFLLLLLNIADGVLAFAGFYTTYPQLAHLEDGFVFLLGPILYFYTQSMVYKYFRLTKKHWLHFIPFLLITISYQLFYHLQSAEYQELIQQAIVRQTLPPGFYFSVALVYLHVISYLVLALRTVAHYRKQIREEFSSIDRINLNWLVFMLASVGVVLSISITYTFLPPLGFREYFPAVFSLAFVLLFIFLSIVLWKGLKQPDIFSGIESDPPSTQKKYATPLLSDDAKRALQKQLEELMVRQRPFLDPDLSLDRLASLINLSPKKLSQGINDVFGQTFFDFINTYRINEAKGIFERSTDKGLTVLEVMYQCGFNSKSSFNTIFRQKTGMTPSAYKASIINARG